jgi:hypothetical protein
MKNGSAAAEFNRPRSGWHASRRFRVQPGYIIEALTEVRMNDLPPPDPVVEIPVRCAACGRESLVEFPVLVIATALTRWNNLRLYSACHDVSWDASPSELQFIRQHLGADWIDRNRPG